MSESQVQSLAQQAFAGINWNLFSEGQFFDAMKNILVGLIDDLKEQMGGEEAVEDMILGFIKPVFDKWAASNKFPAFADNLFWSLVERAVRGAVS